MKLTEKKRQDILEAAISEFREQGFTAARINRIAEQAGVSKRTLYNHFDSKEALFETIIEIVFAETAAIPRLCFDSAVPIETQLLNAAQGYIASFSNERFISLSRLMTSEFLRDQALARRAFQRVEMQDTPLTGLIEEAMKQGVLRQDDPQFAAMQLVSLIKTFFFWPQFLLGENLALTRTDEAVLADCVSMFLKHYQA